MVWRAGDGRSPFHDPIRMPRLPGETKVFNRTNPFFVNHYQAIALDLKGVEAREHTAQVPSDERERREEAFRKADLPVYTARRQWNWVWILLNSTWLTCAMCPPHQLITPNAAAALVVVASQPWSLPTARPAVRMTNIFQTAVSHGRRFRQTATTRFS